MCAARPRNATDQHLRARPRVPGPWRLVALLLGACLCASCVRDVSIGSVSVAAGPLDWEVVSTLEVAQEGPDAAADVPPAQDAAATPDALASVDAGPSDAPPHGECAQPVLQITPGEVVIPSTTLHLCGDDSVPSVHGKVVSWQWSVNKQPDGSNQFFLPGPEHPCPTFRPDVSGKYIFCLAVIDAAGHPGCETVCRTVLVYPDEQIHVELLWQTPADPDESPAHLPGADLDLHFAHEKATGLGIQPTCAGAPHPWFDTSFDCYWNNPKPHWGLANDLADDPSLDLDDQDGAGPENLSLMSPEGSLQQAVHYTVGVHYLNDHGFGVSTAQVRVYRENIPIYDSGPVWLQPLDMWTVGRIAWPNSGNGGLEKPFTPCRMQGNACDGGKAWVPNGQPCVVPCFKPPAAVGEAATCK